MPSEAGQVRREINLLVPRIPWGKMRRALALAASSSDPQSATDKWYHDEKQSFWSLMREMGFCDGGGHVSAQGRGYLIATEVKRNADEGREILADAVRKLPAARLVCSILHGCDNIKLSNVGALLRLHGWDGTGGRASVYHLAHLLNEAGLAAYSKKLDRLRVKWNPDADENAQAPAFISPTTPHSNIRRMRSLLEGMKGDVIWIDKHFDRKAFDIISDGVSAPRVRRVTVISGDANCDSRAKSDYGRLGEELAAKGVVLEWRILPRDLAPSVHDRWLMDGGQCWNIPPVNSLFKGQASEILKSSCRPDVDSYTRKSVALQL